MNFIIIMNDGSKLHARTEQAVKPDSSAVLQSFIAKLGKKAEFNTQFDWFLLMIYHRKEQR